MSALSVVEMMMDESIEPLVMPTLESSPKRIVLLLEDGTHQIVGLLDGQPPTIIHTPAEDGHTLICLGLLRVTPRFILYKEVQEPPMGRFNDTFDPAQV